MIILHDYMEQTDGGSRLCLELARGLEAELLCGFLRSDHPFLRCGEFPMPSVLLPPIPVPLLRQWLLALTFERRTLDVAGHDAAIFSGSYAPLAVRHRPYDSRNILYCHTPPRFLYDQHKTFSARIAPPLRPLFQAFCTWLRPRYAAATARMSAIVTNSYAVRERIRRFLGREAVVVPPPCRVEQYSWEEADGYYLSLSRLDQLKRVDLLVRAFAAMPHCKLLVLSDGPEGPALRRRAANAPNIIFTGVVSEERRRAFLSRCIATLCVAKEEDFGMCAVESLAAGKPAIVSAAGGLREIVLPDLTGLHLPPDPTPEDIRTAVLTLDTAAARAMRKACRARAAEYDLPRFIEGMRRVLRQSPA